MRKHFNFRLNVQINVDLSRCLLALAVLIHALF